MIISEIAKVNDKLGGLIAAMPLMTFFVIFWMHFEGVSDNKISSHVTHTLIYVIPTLPMFILFPFFINKYGFLVSVVSSVFITVLFVLFVHIIVKQYGFKFF